MLLALKLRLVIQFIYFNTNTKNFINFYTNIKLSLIIWMYESYDAAIKNILCNNYVYIMLKIIFFMKILALFILISIPIFINAQNFKINFDKRSNF